MKSALYYFFLVILMILSAAIMATITTFFQLGHFAVIISAATGYFVFYNRKFVFRFLDIIFKKNK